jgi:hypothetical protein
MLDRIHKISEIIGAVALVASLIFVGVQIGQNTDATRVSNSQAALDSWNEITLAVATNDALIQRQRDGMFPELRDRLPYDLEASRMQSWLFAGIKSVESNYLQWLEGNLSDDLWHGYRSTLIVIMSISQDLETYWAVNGHTHSAPFRDLVDEIEVEAVARRAMLIKQFPLPSDDES